MSNHPSDLDAKANFLINDPSKIDVNKDIISWVTMAIGQPLVAAVCFLEPKRSIIDGLLLFKRLDSGI